MGNQTAVLGMVSWRLLYGGRDIMPEVFNVVYHLKQSLAEVMAWPSSVRRDMWNRTQEQYEFERKASQKT